MSPIQLFASPWTAAFLGFPVFHCFRVFSNTCPLSQWCHPTISYSVAHFSSCPCSFPALGAFPVSQLFASGGQSIGTSASVLPMTILGWFRLGLTGLISLQSKELSGSSPVPQFESINSLTLSLLYGPTFTSMHDYWKNHRQPFVSKVM